MSIHIAAFIAGLFFVPLALLIAAHKLRRRSPRVRAAFWGAAIGHIVAIVLATTWGMIPPETLTPGETARGFVSLWSLLLFPLVGALVGWLKPHSTHVALVAAPLLLIAASVEDLVPVSGHWTRGHDEGPTLTVDGTKWTGDTTRFPLAVASNPSRFSSGAISVQFRMLGGKSDQNAGIVFGLDSANASYFFVRYNTKDGDVALWQFSDGKRAVIAHGEPATAKLPLNVWHTLTLRVDDRRVTVTANDSISLAHELPAPVNGRVGLWTKRDAVTAFRRFRASKAP